MLKKTFIIPYEYGTGLVRMVIIVNKTLLPASNVVIPKCKFLVLKYTFLFFYFTWRVAIFCALVHMSILHSRTPIFEK